MTDQDWTKEDSEKMCALLGVPYCGKVDHWGCHHGLLGNFSSPSDKELGVMLRWCMEKERLTVSLSLGTDLETYFCWLEKPRYKSGEYSAPTKALAIRNAIMAYSKEK
jgi:hypothetical protein